MVDPTGERIPFVRAQRLGQRLPMGQKIVLRRRVEGAREQAEGAALARTAADQRPCMAAQG